MTRPLDGQDMSAAASAMGGWHGIGFDEIRIGAELAVREFRVGKDDVRRFAACLGRSIRTEGTARVPAFLLNEFHTLKGAVTLPPGVLHASEDIEILAPVAAGALLRACVRVKDAFLRNGKRFVVLEQEVRDLGREEPALRITRTLFWPC